MLFTQEVYRFRVKTFFEIKNDNNKNVLREIADLIVPVSKQTDSVDLLMGNTIELIKRFIRSQVIETGDKIKWKENFGQHSGPDVNYNQIEKLVIGN
jgi:hypothetical protein